MMRARVRRSHRSILLGVGVSLLGLGVVAGLGGGALRSLPVSCGRTWFVEDKGYELITGKDNYGDVWNRNIIFVDRGEENKRCKYLN